MSSEAERVSVSVSVSVSAVFFDLDGTLLDTAQDFAHAINLMLKEKNKPPVDFDSFRKHIHGDSKKMVSFAFDIAQTHPEFDIIRDEFLGIYHQHSTKKTVFFKGIPALLNHLDAQKIPWGIVTNKPTWLTKPIVKYFQLDQRAACVIAGDTLSTCKPDPAQLHYACQLINISPKQAIYVGDMETDIIAAKNAGMKSMAVTFGYHPPDAHIPDWKADYIANNAEDIVKQVSLFFAK